MISIVVPYYKISFFEDTLRSLAAQTDKRFKVYIGDDASPEDPRFLLNKYKEQIDFVYHRFEENLGGTSLTKQWERCIALSADEEWIMVLGDDDVLGGKVVESFYNNEAEIVDRSINVVRFATQVIDEKGAFITEIYQHPKFEKGLDFFIRKLKWQTRSSLSEYIFKKEAYLKYKFKEYPLAFYSDDQAWVDFTEEKPIFSINDYLIFIRISSQSMSGKVRKEVVKAAEWLYVKQFYNKKLKLLLKKDRFFILKKIEYGFYFNKKINILEWGKLYFKYWKNFDVREIYRFHKRLLKYILTAKY
ncbi:MAG: hypothetical protein RLZZ540_311 [Bacteroidota bacterium]|jgi:glycosyltransferase involved in cell wall biosynthesis